MPEASQGLNHARLAWLRAGLPVETSAATINRFCSSGLQTVAYAAQAIMRGMADVVLAGGIEMMSQVPMSGYHTRLSPAITERYIGMGFTAERVAKRWGITREMADDLRLRQPAEGGAALAGKVFAPEIVPIAVPRDSWEGAKQHHDRCSSSTPTSCPRRTRRASSWRSCNRRSRRRARSRPATRAPYSDGAAAVLLMSRAKADELGLKPLARFVSFATAGVITGHHGRRADQGGAEGAGKCGLSP